MWCFKSFSDWVLTTVIKLYSILFYSSQFNCLLKSNVSVCQTLENHRRCHPYRTMIMILWWGRVCLQVNHRVSWCIQNHLALNALKTVEILVDFRRRSTTPTPITLVDSPVSSLEYFRFLGTTITQDLNWERNICSLTKKVQQMMFFLQQLKKSNLPNTMMVHSYNSIIESILTSSITICHCQGQGGCNTSSALPRGWSTTCPGPWGGQKGLWPTPLTQDTNFLTLSSLVGGCSP